MGRAGRESQRQLSFANQLGEVFITQAFGLPPDNRGKAAQCDKMIGAQLQDDGDKHLAINLFLLSRLGGNRLQAGA